MGTSVSLLANHARFDTIFFIDDDYLIKICLLHFSMSSFID